jgi:5-methylcytosine-specific restriction endonuclease McrA
MKKINKKSKKKVEKVDFYKSSRWINLTKKVRDLYKCGCMKCSKENIETHIDHIFPRSLYPKFQYSIHNLQILCKDCNIEKSNKNNIDYRTAEQRKKCSIKYI